MISGAFHGIGAYRGQKNPIALKRALDTAIATDGEICVADRPIGAFGAILSLNDVTPVPVCYIVFLTKRHQRSTKNDRLSDENT